MASILAIGIATMDLVFRIDRFPVEDEEMRARSLHRCRGGNATNTLVVLSQFGHRCSWAGNYVLDQNALVILDDLSEYSVDVSHSKQLTSGATPLSAILLDSSSGSRTIVHYRDIPEFSYESFSNIPLDSYDWLHFEGRNIAATRQMLEHVRKQCPEIMISLEVEKYRKAIEELYPFADILLFSSAFAESRGMTPETLLKSVSHVSRGMQFCTGGDNGAVAMDSHGHYFSSPAFHTGTPVDTIGAGDTFNAAVIHGCLEQYALPEILELACRLAGRKCGQYGFGGLAEQD